MFEFAGVVRPLLVLLVPLVIVSAATVPEQGSAALLNRRDLTIHQVARVDLSDIHSRSLHERGLILDTLLGTLSGLVEGLTCTSCGVSLTLTSLPAYAYSLYRFSSRYSKSWQLSTMARKPSTLSISFAPFPAYLRATSMPPSVRAPLAAKDQFFSKC